MADPMNLEIPIALIKSHPRQAADLLNSMEHQYGSALISQLPQSLAATLLCYSVPTIATRYLEHLDVDKQFQIVSLLPEKRVLTLLRYLPQEQQSALLQRFSETTQIRLQQYLKCKKNTVAEIMSSEMAVALPHHTASMVLKKLHDHHSTIIDMVYIIDEDYHLLGQIDFKTLIIQPQNIPLETIMSKVLATLKPDMPIIDVESQLIWREVDQLPVVDLNNILLGILTHRNIRHKQSTINYDQKTSTNAPLFEEIISLYTKAISLATTTR